ncbi:MAG: murein biosynthesis integral membrane protein MurJ [Gammaproteobacteria bacterium]|nr:murein biosynthesis integral membrane protein MurJ [Rhodocyclaceae bacterium]MBU3909734.1 murein biosynthesis integral membrane protein MurJ [Gammaproteobacteria bacterium]MBU3990034.1 murein biosynthesis integral membrane protein MurJ [Gammaproteobacteria bacterium]MBU4005267.1 murein biosynthesis integral membrane protein MurJ [Gammaproteobacteria bacterium]MBU4022445.1 murein biosynthesis integral membrane protein MurJ [Gammaproteobacteria bacterium]
MNLLRTLATVSSMTLLSRVLGFVRDFVIARTFGAGMLTDAFFVAFRLPNLLRRLFAEGAFSQAFVPLLAEYRNQRSADETRQLVDRVATLLFMIVLVVAALGVIGAPLLIYATAPGFVPDADKFGLTVTLTRIAFPYILFMSMVALAAGILNTWSRFALPAFTPVLLNLSFIGMALFAAPYFDPPVLVLSWAVFLGGLLQLAIQLPALRRIGMLPRFDFAPGDPGVRRVFKLMAPAVLGVSVSQVSLLINTIFASFLVAGSVSWLYYADRLMEFPAGLLGAALGTILLPSLARAHASDDPQAFSALLDWGLRLTFMLTLPAAVSLAMLGVPLIATLFQHGAFTAADVLQTRLALVAYSIGLTGMILVKILAPGFYARQNIKTPVKIALLTLVATQAMNLAFIVPFKHAGLALSIGLAACLNAALLYYGLRQRKHYTPSPGWGLFLLKIMLALAVLVATLWFGMGKEADWLVAPALERVARLAGLVGAGMAVYLAVLWLLGFRLNDFRQRGST